MDPRKTLKNVTLIVVLGNLALIAYVFLAPSSPKPTPMPNPNGYDDFVKAGSITLDTHRFFNDMSHDELTTFFSTNKTMMEIGRIGLTHECKMPDDYSVDYVGRYIEETRSIRELASAFCAKGKLAELDGRTNEAVECFLSSIKVGEKSGRGGFIVSKKVDSECERIGRSGLGAFTNSLPSSECRKIFQTLEAINNTDESWNDVKARERQLMLKSLTLREKIACWREFLPGSQDRYKPSFQTNILRRTELMLTFAARAYELEKGRRPTNTAELIPSYLKKILQDPVTGTNITSIP